MLEIYFDIAPMTEKEASALKGKFLWGPCRGKEVIGPAGEDVAVYKPDGSPLLVFLHNPSGVFKCLKEALPALRLVGKRWSNARKARSGIMGFQDPTRYEPYARPSKFTRDHPDLWQTVQPLLRRLDEVFKEHLPQQHARQTAFARLTSKDFVIPETCFTTVTVNCNQQFKVHQDKNNLACGFGVMTVWNPSNGNGVLLFPKWKTAVDVTSGDVLLFDGSEWHGNTEVDTDYSERISVVCYYRRRMLGVGTAEEEAEKAQKNAR